MYVKIDEIPIKQKPRSRHTSKKIIICTCDICGKTYSQKYTKPRLQKLQDSLTFCSRTCSNISRKRGGKLCQQIQSSRNNDAWYESLTRTMNKRYGVNNPGQMSNHVEKTRQTLQARYGVNNALQLPITRRRNRETTHTIEANSKRKQTVFKQ